MTDVDVTTLLLATVVLGSLYLLLFGPVYLLLYAHGERERVADDTALAADGGDICDSDSK